MDAKSTFDTPALQRGYVQCRFGHLHYTQTAPHDGALPTLVLLHQNPSSSVEYAKLMLEMGRDCRVIAFDTPGNGMSDPPPAPLSMTDYAQAFADGLDALELGATQPVDVFGYHTGSFLAVELALVQPQRVGRLALSGLPMRTPDERATRLADSQATPGPTEDGAAILARIGAMWDFTVTTRDRRVDIERATEIFAERIKTLHRYWWPYYGVWSYPAETRLPLVQQAVLVVQPIEPLLEPSQRACALFPRGHFIEMPTLDRDVFEVGVTEVATELRKFFT